MFEKLKEILGDEHDLLLVLVSFLFPEDLISESVLNDSMRKAYANAIEMILNIEVRCVLFFLLRVGYNSIEFFFRVWRCFYLIIYVAMLEYLAVISYNGDR